MLNWHQIAGFLWRQEDAIPGTFTYVGINSSIATLEQREKERGDRIIGSARAQWQDVHIGVKYDVEINTDELSLDDCVSNIIEKLGV